MASFRGRLHELMLRATNQKDSIWRLTQRLAGEQASGRFSTKKRDWLEAPVPPRWMRRKYRVATRQVNGRNVFPLSPRGRVSERHILYLHGGAYIKGFIRGHWQFVGRLIDELECTITAPDCPLAPEHAVSEVFAMLLRVYAELVAEAEPHTLILMGDSAGGGLALGLAQEVRSEGLPRPRRIILLSPWLDVTMSNPEIAERDRNDPIVSVRGCIAAGRRYARGTDPRDSRVSPIHGDLRSLAPIALLIGTRDVLVNDCRKLRARAEAEGVPLDYREHEGMIHDWMLFGLPESEPAVSEIVALVTERGDTDPAVPLSSQTVPRAN